MTSSQEEYAREIALRLLERRSLTAQQLRDKLANRNVPTAVIERLVTRFGEVGLIDDADYAQRWARTRTQVANYGARRIAVELRQRGVADEHIAAALADLTEEDELAAARKVAAKRVAAAGRGGPDAAKRRLVAALQRRGFNSDVVWQVVEEHLG